VKILERCPLRRGAGDGVLDCTTSAQTLFQLNRMEDSHGAVRIRISPALRQSVFTARPMLRRGASALLTVAALRHRHVHHAGPERVTWVLVDGLVEIDLGHRVGALLHLVAGVVEALGVAFTEVLLLCLLCPHFCEKKPKPKKATETKEPTHELRGPVDRVNYGGTAVS
jgi:hypothetical protein